MDPFEAKLFEGATSEEKFEIAVRALGHFAKILTLQAIRLSEAVDRLDKIEQRLEAKSWVKAISAELDRRKEESAST